MRSRTPLTGLVIFAFFVGGCVGDGGVSETTPPTSAPSTAATAAPTTTVGGQRGSDTESVDTGPFEVATTVISHSTTREISVWAPEAEGPWPIVYALHGFELNRNDLAVMAEELASRGVVVFAADWQPESGEMDLECGHRYVVSVAEDFGGDLDQPFTLVGHSGGGTAVFEGGLNEAAYGPDGLYRACFEGRPMPDVIVAISGCHYELEGESYPFDLSRYGNSDANLVLIAGAEDQICEAWQSRDAAEALRAAGYSADFVEIEGGNHNTVIFHDCQGREEGAPSFCVGEERLTFPDNPAGLAVVETIFDAIQAAQD